MNIYHEFVISGNTLHLNAKDCLMYLVVHGPIEGTNLNVK